MSPRIISFMTIVVLFGMAIILLLNLTTLLSPPPIEKYLSFNGVRGMDIQHDNKLYTLNFEQQNQLIAYINESISVGGGTPKSQAIPLNFTKLAIYRFDKPDLVVNPIAYDGDDLVYQATEWNAQGYLKDTTQGSMKELIAGTYDP